MSAANYAEINQYFGRPVKKIVADAVLTGGAVIILSNIVGLPGIAPQTGLVNIASQGLAVSVAVIAGNIAEDMLEKSNII